MESNTEITHQLPRFTMEFNAEITSLLNANADPTNWDDRELPSSVWTKADNRWQAFAAKWREHNGPVYKVVGGARIIDLSDIRYLVQATLNPLILVRTCYDDAVISTLGTASDAVTRNAGMIFTGQPGIGKTTFLLYLLVVLLQRKQIVLLTLVPSEPPLLFYHDGVYEATKMPPITSFPYPKGPVPVLIWSLFEAHQECVPDSAYNAPILFPVQAPSPNPKLYARWRKHRCPDLSAFPLWDVQELKQGLRLHADFVLLQGELGSMLETWQDRSRDASFKCSRALQLLRAACGDERPESVDVAVDVLLEATITAFGPIARDVFTAIRQPGGYDNVLALHDAAYVGYKQLKKILRAVGHWDDLGTDVTRVICIRSLSEVGQPSMEWSVAFKSDMIAQRMSEKWIDAQEGRVSEMIEYLSTAPDGKAFVGWLFAALAHRRIQAAADGAQEYWSVKPMTLQHPSTFVLDISTESIPKIPKKDRRFVYFNTESITGERLELRDDEYYIPAIRNFPLIDSFLVTFEPGDAPTANLWLFQMATARHRGSSRMGYDRIQNIISMLDKQLRTQRSPSHDGPPTKRRKSEEAEVRVHYVLACAAGDQIQQWTLPPGWADKVTGDGYLMELGVLH